jgi:phenylpropionate dioxygenase-like ring-hydroxylating dioxygenase large terminal subunit
MAQTGQAVTQTGTIPWSWYTDPAVLEQERERIFRRAWHYVGHAGQVAEAGDFIACRPAGVPAMVVRDREGALRAFLNVCRHRGAELVSGCGRRQTIQCPYHAWTYGLDGSLRAAPRSRDEPGFDRSGLGLVPLPVGTWGPFVFVNPDPAAAPLSDALGDLPEVVAASGLDLDGLRFHSRVTYSLAANWKIAAENYLECYHCEINHPGLTRLIDDDRSRYLTGPSRWSQFTPVQPSTLAADGDPYDARGAVSEAQFHLVWPALKINVVPGRLNLSIGPLEPVAPDRTDGFLDYFFGDDAGDEWIRRMLAFDDLVGAEDRGLVESVQRGVSSGVLGEGRLLAVAESHIASFQARVRETQHA